jgi:hypothetical protein
VVNVGATNTDGATRWRNSNFDQEFVDLATVSVGVPVLRAKPADDSGPPPPV